MITNPKGERLEILAYNPETQTVMVLANGKANLIPVTDIRADGGGIEVREALGQFSQQVQNEIVNQLRNSDYNE